MELFNIYHPLSQEWKINKINRLGNEKFNELYDFFTGKVDDAWFRTGYSIPTKTLEYITHILIEHITLPKEPQEIVDSIEKHPYITGTVKLRGFEDAAETAYILEGIFEKEFKNSFPQNCFAMAANISNRLLGQDNDRYTINNAFFKQYNLLLEIIRKTNLIRDPITKSFFPEKTDGPAEI